jgi:predicted nucleotidyltransferase
VTHISLQTYTGKREQLLAKIIAAISGDDRFVAAWLTGSYGRSNQDALSDIDISIVVNDEHSDHLRHNCFLTGLASLKQSQALLKP